MAPDDLAARLVEWGLPPGPAGPGPGRPGFARRHPGRLPRRPSASAAPGVRGRRHRAAARVRSGVAALPRSRGGGAPPAHAGARALAPRPGAGASGRRARRRARPGPPGASRPGRGRAQRPGGAGHRRRPAVPVRPARDAGRLPASGHVVLDARRGGDRGRRRVVVGAGGVACRSGTARRAVLRRLRSGCISTPPPGARSSPAARASRSRGSRSLRATGRARSRTRPTGWRCAAAPRRPRGRWRRSRRSSRRGAARARASCWSLRARGSANVCKACWRGTTSMPCRAMRRSPRRREGRLVRSPSSSAT